MKRRFTIENEGAVYGEASFAAFVSRPLVSLLARTEIVLVATVVLAAVGWQWVLGGMIRVPTIFGDELIYWEMSRAFAATGHFAVRGGGHPGYGIGYPALISVAHLLSPTETGAYVVGRVINSALFSLAAIPAYSIARRVLSRNAAIFAALLAVAPGHPFVRAYLGAETLGKAHDQFRCVLYRLTRKEAG